MTNEKGRRPTSPSTTFAPANIGADLDQCNPERWAVVVHLPTPRFAGPCDVCGQLVDDDPVRFFLQHGPVLLHRGCAREMVGYVSRLVGAA